MWEMSAYVISNRYLFRIKKQMNAIDCIEDDKFRKLLQGLLMKNMYKDIDNAGYSDDVKLSAKKSIGMFYHARGVNHDRFLDFISRL